jgi:hypothetical protein
MRAYLRYQIARVEQHEFSGVGLGRANFNDKTLEVTTGAQLQFSASRVGLLLKLSLQFLGERAARSMRPMNYQYAHGIVPVIAPWSGCGILCPHGVKVLQRNRATA